jgi:hypothetical protein
MLQSEVYIHISIAYFYTDIDSFMTPFLIQRNMHVDLRLHNGYMLHMWSMHDVCYLEVRQMGWLLDPVHVLDMILPTCTFSNSLYDIQPHEDGLYCMRS